MLAELKKLSLETKANRKSQETWGNAFQIKAEEETYPLWMCFLFFKIDKNCFCPNFVFSLKATQNSAGFLFTLVGMLILPEDAAANNLSVSRLLCRFPGGFFNNSTKQNAQKHSFCPRPQKSLLTLAHFARPPPNHICACRVHI